MTHMTIPSLYSLHPPTTTPIPVIASLPHSGLYVPPDRASHFFDKHRRWLRNTDWFLPLVYDFLPSLGITTLVAHYSRYVIDLNRDPSACLFGDFEKSLIAERTADGEPIYAMQPLQEELQHSIKQYYTPYHTALQENLFALQHRFGHALLLDLHAFMGPIDKDICLGNRKGTTCDHSFFNHLIDTFQGHGFSTADNSPFSGGYITRYYATFPNIQTLQIELRYTNYMDCSVIDSPPMPRHDPTRIKALQPRLMAALRTGLHSFLNKTR